METWVRVLGVVAAVWSAVGGAPAAAQQHDHQHGPETDTLRLMVTLREFAFVPDTVRLPAGRPVVLTLVNVGRAPHEFVVGRDVADRRFAEDLFAGVSVAVEGATDAGLHAGHGAAGRSAMVAVSAGARARVAFTLPPARAGRWTVACFVPGHYEAGMTGVVLVS